MYSEALSVLNSDSDATVAIDACEKACIETLNPGREC